MAVIPITEQNLGSAFLKLWARSFLLHMPVPAQISGSWPLHCSLWDLAGLIWEGCSLWFGLTGEGSREAGPCGAQWAVPWPVPTAWPQCPSMAPRQVRPQAPFIPLPTDLQLPHCDSLR